ncbi:MAG TPA: hypothetical protein VF556_01940 [Pyrinomonadaceae bacterium]|jgi:hypothetical protein
MNKTKGSIFSLATLVFCSSFAIAQVAEPIPDVKKKNIKIVGKVVGFDSLAALSNITYAPQSQLLILRIDNLLKGKEKARHIKIVYEYFSTEAAYLSELLSDKNQKWKLNIARDASCDSTLKESKYSKSYSIDNKEELLINRLKDVDGLENIPENTKLPCYILKNNGIKKHNP